MDIASLVGLVGAIGAILAAMIAGGGVARGRVSGLGYYF